MLMRSCCPLYLLNFNRPFTAPLRSSVSAFFLSFVASSSSASRSYSYIFTWTALPASRPFLNRRYSTNYAPSFTSSSSSSSPFFILGIETSCDDTGLAIVSSTGAVLASALSSQWHIHAEHGGGILPNLAAREHDRVLQPMLERVLQESGLVSPKNLTAIAVTIGPGLAPCLDTGLKFAQNLALQHQLPLLPINHLEAHALVARLPSQAPPPPAAPLPPLPLTASASASPPIAASPPPPPPAFPFLVLLISGGHSQLWYAASLGSYNLLGDTVDDAIGEAFDKACRLLTIAKGPTEHGGSAVERMAFAGNPSAYPFPVAMRKHAGCDLSFSGLKTSLRRAVRMLQEDMKQKEGKQVEIETGGEERKVNKQNEITKNRKGREEGEEEIFLPLALQSDLAASFQRAAVAQLVNKTSRAIRWAALLGGGSNSNGTWPADKEGAAIRPRELVLCGGAASNSVVRTAIASLCQEQGLTLIVPPRALCADNGIMIAWAGVEYWHALTVGPSAAAAAILAATARARAVPVLVQGEEAIMALTHVPRMPVGPSVTVDVK